MTTHTPGPWAINNWPQAGTDIAIGATGTPLIARVALRDVSINEQKANASLIAAAPALLELCERALRALSEDDFPGLRDDLRAAITQATGEQA